MRDIILNGNQADIASCAFAAGELCNKLQKIKLPYPGFFKIDSSIKPFLKDEEFHNFTFQMLGNDLVAATLGKKLCQQVLKWVQQHQDCLASLDHPNLTHADLDPANILVKEVNDTYQITALLDWEFCFSGSYLMDVGHFLRYSHKLPSIYKNNFIKGLCSDGSKLPADWELKSKALDLLCLLNLLYLNPKAKRPKLNKDVLGLINHTVNLQY